MKFITFGCKVNQYDSEALKELFQDRGFEISDWNPQELDNIDVAIINTCTVTHLADRKARQHIRKLKRRNPNCVIAVTGCYPQTDPQTVKALEGVDIVHGIEDRSGLVELVEQALSKENIWQGAIHLHDSRPKGEFENLKIKNFKKHDRTRHFLKIQEGCDQFCSYCIIPYARGHLRSRPPEDVISEIKQAVSNGFKEIVLTGINLGAYGRENSNLPNLATLLDKIIHLKGDYRIRLSSCEPQEITIGLLELVTNSEKICKHLHIPLQSGDNEILKAMNRDYSKEDYRKIVMAAREKSPSIAITTDIIVGFPGESANHFRNTKEFVKKIGFSDIHIFQYSPRKNTPAQEFSDQVHSKEKKARSQELIEISRDLSRVYHEQFIDKTVPVLVEKHEEDVASGVSDTYLKVTFNVESEINLYNKICQVQINSADEEMVYGELPE